jgi:hypothetical protein
MLGVALIVMLIGGFGARAIALSKNREGAPFFFLGLFLPLPAIVIACLIDRLPRPELVDALERSRGR